MGERLCQLPPQCGIVLGEFLDLFIGPEISLQLQNMHQYSDWLETPRGGTIRFVISSTSEGRAELAKWSTSFLALVSTKVRTLPKSEC